MRTTETRNRGAAQVRGRKPPPGQVFGGCYRRNRQILHPQQQCFIQSLIYSYQDGLRFATVLFDDSQVAINHLFIKSLHPEPDDAFHIPGTDLAIRQ
jgi:hypothetical protein